MATQTGSMEKFFLRNGAGFPSRLSTEKRRKASNLPRFTKYGQEPNLSDKSQKLWSTAIQSHSPSRGRYVYGHTTENIQPSFPLLTLEQVYGAIPYSLVHREGINTGFQEQKVTFETFKETLHQHNPHLAHRIAEIK